MGRRPKAAVESAEAVAAPAEEKAPVVRRRRRTTVNLAEQANVLISSLLTTRGATGASLDEILAVVSWARQIHEEGLALRTLATRPRRARAEGIADRQVSYEVNKALLDKVLAGAIRIDVGAESSLIFSDGRDPMP